MKTQKFIWSFVMSSTMLLSNIACSQEPQAIIPHTNIPLETLVFAPGQNFVQAVSPGTYDICRDAAMTPEFGVPSIKIWTSPIFRTAIPTNEHCAFGVMSKRRYHPQTGDIRTKDCIARLRSNGTQVTSITMFVNEETKRHYFQCEFRLSMAFIGFQGALNMPEDVLFVASDHPGTLYGYPILRAYSRIMPAPFVHLQWACRIWPTVVYQPKPGQTRKQVNSNFRNSQCKKN
jgi:hypothetical protein